MIDDSKSGAEILLRYFVNTAGTLSCLAYTVEPPDPEAAGLGEGLLLELGTALEERGIALERYSGKEWLHSAADKDMFLTVSTVVTIQKQWDRRVRLLQVLLEIGALLERAGRKSGW